MGWRISRKQTFGAAVTVIAALVAALAVAVAQPGVQAANADGPLAIRGGGVTIVEGGTGEPEFAPVITKFAIHWDGEKGALECLALTPSEPAGDPGSGNFDKNVMYVTGEITSAEKHGKTAVLKGTATVTGVGAGSDQPFTVTVTEGGPGATFVLEVSGLTFRETVLEGEIDL